MKYLLSKNTTDILVKNQQKTPPIQKSQKDKSIPTQIWTVIAVLIASLSYFYINLNLNKFSQSVENFSTEIQQVFFHFLYS